MEDTQHSKKSIAIIGGGGLGRELESWFSQSNLIEEFDLVGYLDDDKDSLNGYKNDYKIIDDINNKSLEKSKNVLIAIANCKTKEEVFAMYEKNKNFNILSFTHSSTIVGKHVDIDMGVVISPNTIISCNAKINKGVFINCGSQIGHDVIVGNYSSIMADVNIGGGAVIGNNVTIGSGAIILPKVKIPDNVIVGAGSVVLRSIKKVGTYFGNPARRIL